MATLDVAFDNNYDHHRANITLSFDNNQNKNRRK